MGKSEFLPARILIRKTSLVDYPACVSAVFFFSGCNLRCPWCHNRQLVCGEEQGLLSVDEGFAHIKKRRAVLGGVVLSGGEPCFYEGLPALIGEIKKLNLLVKLDTNGMVPEMLENLFRREETRPDYIALDLKVAPGRYGELRLKNAHSDDPGAALCESANLIGNSGIKYECRTLALPGGFISESDIEALSPLAGEAVWHFRLFRGGNCLDSAWDGFEESAETAQAKANSLAEKARALGKMGVAQTGD